MHFDLRRCFLVRQNVAGVLGAGRIDRYAAFIDVLDNSVLINYERGAIAIATLFVKDAVIFHDGAFERCLR